MMIYLVKLKRPPKEYQLASYAYPPFELLSLSTALRRQGIESRCLHASIPEVIDALAQAPISAYMVLDVPFYELISDAVELCQAARRLRPDLRTVWVGEFPSAYPQVCAASPLADYAIRGDFEEALTEIINGSIPGQGVYWSSENGQVIGSGATASNLAAFTPCDWDQIRIADYIYTTRSGARVLPFLSSKGCNYNCHFCYLSRPENLGKWVGLDAESVNAQIKQLKDKADFNEVHFNDRNFMRHSERAYKILHALKNDGLTLHALDVRLDAIDPQMVQELCDLGVRGLFVGIESSQNRLLELMNKRISREQIREKIEMLAAFPQLKVYGNVITCLPTQTEQEFREDLRFALSLKRSHPHLSLSIQSFFPWPETPMGALAIANGYCAPATLEAWPGHLITEFFPFPSWLQWNRINPAIIFDILRYRNIINFCREPNSQTNLVLAIENRLGNLFFRVSAIRLKFLWFKAPLDLRLFELLARINFRLKKHLRMFA